MNCKRCGACCYLKREWVDGKIVNSEPCPFLAYEDELAICIVYDNRPEVCRDYCCDREPLIPDREWNCQGLKADLKRMDAI